MSKGTKSFGHDKALACESRGFVYNKKGCIVLTHPRSYREFAQGGYDVTYLGKDWYQVTAPKSSGNSLKLKVVLYGPWVCPAIMGIKNPIRNVNYCPQRFSEE